MVTGPAVMMLESASMWRGRRGGEAGGGLVGGSRDGAGSCGLGVGCCERGLRSIGEGGVRRGMVGVGRRGRGSRGVG